MLENNLILGIPGKGKSFKVVPTLTKTTFLPCKNGVYYAENMLILNEIDPEKILFEYSRKRKF